MPCIVEGRSKQVVHRRVHHGETLLTVALEILDPGEEHTGVAHDGAAGFEHEHQVSSRHPLHDCSGECRRLRRGFITVPDAESAAEIEVRDGNSFQGERVGEPEQAIQRVAVGFEAPELRADVAVDALHFERRVRGCPGVQRSRVSDGDAELVLAQTGRDVRMGPGVDVRVDAQRHRRPAPVARCERRQPVELPGRLHVEASDPGFERRRHLVVALADAREHDARARHAGGEHARELSDRDNVEPGAKPCEHVDDREVRVRLDGVADLVRNAGERPVISVPGVLDRGARVDEAGCSRFARNAFEIHTFDGGRGPRWHAGARQVSMQTTGGVGRRYAGRESGALGAALVSSSSSSSSDCGGWYRGPFCPQPARIAANGSDQARRRTLRRSSDAYRDFGRAWRMR